MLRARVETFEVTEGIVDVWIDGKIAEYEVPVDQVEDVLVRQRVNLEEAELIEHPQE